MSPEALARLREAAEHIFSRPSVNKHDLRALLDAYDTARAEGVAAERARVVAWLRDRFEADDEMGDEGHLADCVERGEHQRSGS